jgi:very-short-patch-repair endonuclease
MNPAILAAMKLPIPVKEHKFHPTRKWRLDWAFLDAKLGIEQEGGIWSGGRHTHPMGFSKDMEKYNALTLEGWALLRFTPQQIMKGECYGIIKEWFNRRGLGC